MCIPEAWLPWAVISGGLTLALLLLSWAASLLEARYERRETLRRMTPQRAHAHVWIRGEADEEGIAVEECLCTATRLVRGT